MPKVSYKNCSCSAVYIGSWICGGALSHEHFLGVWKPNHFYLRLWVSKRQTNGSLQSIADSHCLWQGKRPIATRPAHLWRWLFSGGLGWNAAASDNSAPELLPWVGWAWRIHGDLLCIPLPFSLQVLPSNIFSLVGDCIIDSSWS